MGIERQPADASAEKRYAPRRPVVLTLRAWVDGAERRLTVRDLSHTGFLAETVPGLELGNTVELELPNEMRREARVVWAGATQAGCTFAKPISKAAFGAALLKSDFVGADAERRPSLSEHDLTEAEDELPPIEKLPVWGRITVIGTTSIAVWSVLLLVGSVVI